MIVSSGLLVLESVLQIYVTVSHSKFSESLFIALLALVMGPIIVINFISAIQVTRTQDFSDKKFGRAICIAFHSFQLGMIWRSFKLVILYDSRDWSEFLALRILHAGFQSLPYGIVLVVSLLLYNSNDPLRIVSAVVSLVSAAVALSSYRLGDTLYESEEFETRKMKIKRNVGVILLVLSKLFLLFCRCACICLFSVVHPVWIGVILGTHYILQLLTGLMCKICRHKLTVPKFLKLLYMSYFNVFDLTGKGYSGIKCSYVFYYATILVENIVMSAFWMLTADQGERYKLVTVFLVLMSFIVGMIVKFTSCGCIFRIEESLLEDAFNNPVVKVNVDNEVTVPKIDATPNGVIHESSQTPDQTVSVPRAISRGKSPSNTKRSISNKDSKSTKSSKSASKASFDNNAFISSQGSINRTQDKPKETKSAKTTSNVSGNSQSKQEEKVNKHKMDSIVDLASSYSRNTNTLNVSNKPRYFNSFDDPFRERNRIQVNLTSSKNRQQHSHHNRSQSHALRTIYGTHRRSSLDSSELYPSESSVTSSSVSYMNTNGRPWDKPPTIRIKPYSADNDGYTTDVSNSEMVSYDYTMEDSSSWTSESSDSVSAITWPPSHTTNLLKMYNISDSVSSKDNVMHWLDSVDPDIDTTHDLSFPTVNDLSIIPDDASEASMPGMKRFEVQKKKDKIRLKKILPKTKEVFLKFRSLNYKSKDKELNDRPYPLNRKKQEQSAHDNSPRNPLPKTGMAQSTVQFRGNVMQESIV